MNKARSRLFSLDPKVAEGAQKIVESGNKKAIADAQKKVELGARRAKLISGGKTFADKQRINRELAAEAQAAGEDITDFLDRANLSEDQFNLDIQKDMIMAQDLKMLFKPTEQFEDVLDAQGNVIAQKSTTTGKVIADPRAVEAPTPQTPIAKARADLKAGLITQKDFNTIQKTPRKAQSKVGKLLEDQRAIIADFGEGSPQAQAISEAITSEQKGEKPKLTDVAGIRKEFTKQSGDFIKLRDAIGKLRDAAANPSGPGDISMIFNFMKILDPGSTVREGEFATAQNSGGVDDTVRAKYNQIVGGERLTEDQRNAFLKTANGTFNSQLRLQRQLEKSFRAIAERSNMNPDNVVVDFVGAIEESKTVDVNGTPAQVGAIITNNAGQKGRVEADGTITPLP